MKRNLGLVSLIAAVVCFIFLGSVYAAPTMVNYHGYLEDNEGAFTGTANIKFAIVDSLGMNFWTNDGSKLLPGEDSEEPIASVSVTVTDGILNVILGDTSLTNMVVLNAIDFANNDELYLRVYVSTDGSTFDQLTPDKRFVSSPYAMTTDYVGSKSADDIVDITSSQTLTNKTLDVAELDEVTISETCTAEGATWTNLGTVEEVDINGGTIDDVENITVDNLSLDGNTISAIADEIIFGSDIETDRWLGYDSNTLIGVDVAGAGTLSYTSGNTGQNNTFIGNEAGYSVQTGYSNVAVGADALYANQTGYANVAIGQSALENSDASYNIAIGYDALGEHLSGQYNTVIGFWSLKNNESGEYNTVVGASAGLNQSGSVKSASNNCLFGNYAGTKLDDGNNNILIGFRAGDNIVSGSDNIIISYNEDAPAADTSNHLNIGGVIYGELDNSYIGIATTNPEATLDVNGDLYMSGGDIKTDRWLESDYNTFIGVGVAGTTLTHTTSNEGYYNTFIGYQAGNSITTAYTCTAVGAEALSSLSSGYSNSAFGKGALESNTSANGNTGIGAYALQYNTEGERNTAVGWSANYRNEDGEQNTAIGVSALKQNESGSYNVGVGYLTLENNLDGNSNVAIGTEAGGAGGDLSQSYSNNCLLGYQAGYNIETGADNNILIGSLSGDNITSGSDNIIIGYDLEAPAADTSNHLNIGGLIYGDLDSDYVGITAVVPTSSLDINAANGYEQLRLRASYTPTGTGDSNGSRGDVAWDSNYFYIKTSSGWKRAALSTF